MSDKILVWADGRYHAMPAELWEGDKVSEKITTEGVGQEYMSRAKNAIGMVKVVKVPMDCGVELGQRYKVTLDPIESEPKPCPFCGGEAVVDTTWDGKHRVRCRECYVHTRHKRTRAIAIKAWNRREGE